MQRFLRRWGIPALVVGGGIWLYHNHVRPKTGLG